MALPEETFATDTKSGSPLKTSSTTGKRKRTATSQKKAAVDDLGDETSVDVKNPSPSKVQKRSPKKPKDEEKRLRRHRSYAPSSYLEKLQRATTQRMFVIDRARDDQALEETVIMAGSTGNIYSLIIGLVPSCTCPDNQKGNQCKHIIYVLHNVLKAPAHLQYQLAFLTSELRAIFDNAPLHSTPSTSTSKTESANRKPIEGDCPICFIPLEPDDEEIVFCRAACGNNIHAECFEQWAKSQVGKEVRCVYCRTPWQGDEEQVRRICRDKARQGGKEMTAEGYVNVAGELGMTGVRDTSTYHQSWVRRQQRMGYF